MAGSAGHIRMAVCQQESGGSMVKIRSIPAFRGMAVRAIDQCERGPRGRVYRIIRLLPGR